MLSLVPLIIGFVLGLLGGGGTVLAVPALIYFYGLGAKEAIATGLLVVGLSSMLVSAKAVVKSELPLRVVFVFTMFAILGAYLSAKFLAVYVSGELQILLFAILTLVIGLKMLFGGELKFDNAILKAQVWLLALITGIVTGLVGVGGGFLIVPALHYLLDLPMKQAVKSSLLIIALQSLSAFAGYISSVNIDYQIVSSFTLWVLAGMIAALGVRGKINDVILRRIFAILLIIVGIYIALKQFGEF